MNCTNSLAAPPSELHPAGAHQSHALLIGIWKYPQASGVPALVGPEQDIELIQELLRTRFQVPEQNITVLRNDQATHLKIQKAFQDLEQRVKPGDFIYIHYSGHGSYCLIANCLARRPDLREAIEKAGDTTLQTWVAFGSRSKELEGLDGYDVLDKEIRGWLSSLYAKTDQVVFVSDSCHSATVSRGLNELTSRMVDPDPRKFPQIEIGPGLGSDAPGIRIGAARDSESAAEADVKTFQRCTDPKNCSGVFTWHWVRALHEAKPGVRWGDAFQRAFALVTAQRDVKQQPQAEGHLDMAVFGGQFIEAKPVIPIKSIDERAGTATIPVGGVAGVTEGSTYGVYEPGTTSPVPVLKIEKVQPFESIGTLERSSLKTGDLVTEVVHAYRIEPVRIAMSIAASMKDNALSQKVQAVLAEAKGFQLVQSPGEADWVVTLLHISEMEGSTAPGRRKVPMDNPKGQPEIWVSTSNGELIHDRMRIRLTDQERAAGILRDNLEAFAWAKQLKQLDTGSHAVPLKVEFSIAREDASCTNDDMECFSLDKSASKKRLGPYHPLSELRDVATYKDDLLAFRIRNDGDTTWYGYLLDIAPDSSIALIFPRNTANREDAGIPSKELHDVYRKERRLASLMEVGVETLVLIATAEPINAQLFEHRGYVDRGLDDWSSTSPVERLLRTAASGTRGAVEVPSAAIEWATWQVTANVKDKSTK